MINRVLAIETSCDDTSVAIVNQRHEVEAMLSADQNLVHAPFGGVVPEIASRNHTAVLLPLVDKVMEASKLDWSSIDGIAVTSRPGLLGSLLVGVINAKTLALLDQKPLIGVNHLHGHIFAPFLRDEKYQPQLELSYPFLALAVSGGHTQIYVVHEFSKIEVLGRTIDDAAGEAIDKFAKSMGLGFPGGAIVDGLAQPGQRDKYKFPRPLIFEMTKNDNLDFSFSGLKTAVQIQINKLSPEDLQIEKHNLCASFQEAVVETLFLKLERAQRLTKIKKIVVTGGVSANSRLRQLVTEWCLKKQFSLAIPPIRYCTDNAAMIGLTGLLQLQLGQRSPLSLAPRAQSLDSDFFRRPDAHA